MTIIDYFKKSLQNFPDKIATKDEKRELSYSQLFFAVNNITKELEKYNLSDKRIGLLFDNSVEFLTIIIAAANLGLSIFPLNIFYSKSQLTELCNKLKIDIIITNKEIFIDNLKVIVKNTINYNGSDKDIYTPAPIDPNSPYLISMTSGSTSHPKPIVLSQKTKIKRAFLSAINLYGLNNNDKILVATPMYHSLGFRLSLLPLYIGASGYIMKKFSPEEWISTIENDGITFSILVSNQVDMIINYLEHNKVTPKLSSLKTLVSSSALLSEDSKIKLLKFFKGDFHEIYGTSETGTATNIHFNKDKKIGSVGKPLDYVDIKILNAEENGIGEIAIKTDTIFDYYMDLPEITKNAFEDGYFKTGDLGYLDNENYLYYKGRKKFIIKVGAINVFPEDIEAVLDSFDGIEKSIVIGVEERIYGNKIIAYYKKSKNTNKEISPQQLRLFCFKNLASYQVPSEFIEIDEIPQNSIGKLDRNILIKKYMEEHYEK